MAGKEALLCAAIRAACQARAPRRTIAAVAAAVTTALLQQPATVKATPAEVPKAPTGPVQPLEEAEAQLKEARAAKRKLKRQKRRERARAAAATGNKEGTLDAPQAEAVGDAEQAVSGAGGESTPRRMTAPTIERGHTGLTPAGKRSALTTKTARWRS